MSSELIGEPAVGAAVHLGWLGRGAVDAARRAPGRTTYGDCRRPRGPRTSGGMTAVVSPAPHTTAAPAIVARRTPAPSPTHTTKYMATLQEIEHERTEENEMELTSLVPAGVSPACKPAASRASSRSSNSPATTAAPLELFLSISGLRWWSAPARIGGGRSNERGVSVPAARRREEVSTRREERGGEGRRGGGNWEEVAEGAWRSVSVLLYL